MGRGPILVTRLFASFARTEVPNAKDSSETQRIAIFMLKDPFHKL
tara:strand:- start:324 stop:458 length:135 start_codon:yes stop_codon:yes gene_type:complete